MKELANTFMLINESLKRSLKLQEIMIEQLEKKQKKKCVYIVESKICKTAGDICPICMQNLEMDMHSTICQHKFHSGCFSQFLFSGGDKCPICKSDIQKIEINAL